MLFSLFLSFFIRVRIGNVSYFNIVYKSHMKMVSFSVVEYLADGGCVFQYEREKLSKRKRGCGIKLAS